VWMEGSIFNPEMKNNKEREWVAPCDSSLGWHWLRHPKQNEGPSVVRHGIPKYSPEQTWMNPQRSATREGLF
jgi:hypothetical protein